ncbi:MAG: hypothetical protein ACKVN9_01725 [Methylophilaceae bacterium]
MPKVSLFSIETHLLVASTLLVIFSFPVVELCANFSVWRSKKLSCSDWLWLFKASLLCDRHQHAQLILSTTPILHKNKPRARAHVTTPVREVIQHGSNGLLVDFFDIEVLSKTMNNALGTAEKFKLCRTSARETVTQNYESYKELAQYSKVMNLLHSALANKIKFLS